MCNVGFGGFCVIFVVFVNFVCFNGSVVFFGVLYGFVVGFVIFLPRWRCALVARMDLFRGLCLWCVHFPVCICVMNCGGPCYGLICGAYIICGLGFGFVGWPSLAVCVPLI